MPCIAGLAHFQPPAPQSPSPRQVLLCSLLHSLKKNTHTYFYTSFVAYIFGLGLTIFIMHIFKHAQVSSALLLRTDACSLTHQPGHKCPTACQEKVDAFLLLALLFLRLSPAQSSGTEPCWSRQRHSSGLVLWGLFAAELP